MPEAPYCVLLEDEIGHVEAATAQEIVKPGLSGSGFPGQNSLSAHDWSN